MMYVRNSLIGLFAPLLVLFSCVNDLEEIQKITFDPKSPDEVTKTLRVYYSENGNARVEVFAEIAENFSKPEKITKLRKGVKVHFFAADGKVVSTLTANYGEINYARKIFFVRDSVQLYNHAKKQRMETESLFWNQKDSTIYTNAAVVVRTPKGVVYGDGIRTKQDFSSYVFLKPRGKMEIDEQ